MKKNKSKFNQYVEMVNVNGWFGSYDEAILTVARIIKEKIIEDFDIGEFGFDIADDKALDKIFKDIRGKIRTYEYE